MSKRYTKNCRKGIQTLLKRYTKIVEKVYAYKNKEQRSYIRRAINHMSKTTITVYHCDRCRKQIEEEDHVFVEMYHKGLHENYDFCVTCWSSVILESMKKDSCVCVLPENDF